jgi:DNA-binding transcriptional LysR family regulator
MLAAFAIEWGQSARAARGSPSVLLNPDRAFLNTALRSAALDATRLKQLRFVVAVAERGSMAEAAAALHMTPSAASMLLRSVEQALGGRLFERSAHGMVPTRLALGLIPRIRTLLGEADALAAALQTPDERPAMRMGVVPHVSATVLPQVVAALVNGKPPWRVQLHEGRASTLAEMLHDAQLDLLLGKMPADFPVAKLARLDYRLLYRDGIAVVVRKGHALARLRRPVGLDDLQAAPWVLPPAGSTTRTAFVNAWLGAGQLPPVGTVESP